MIELDKLTNNELAFLHYAATKELDNHRLEYGINPQFIYESQNLAKRIENEYRRRGLSHKDFRQKGE